MLEAIGGKGGSFILAVEEIPDMSIPYVIVARRILGVLY
jgi:hypothetical protein